MISVNNYQKKFDKSIDHLKSELVIIRTGRATPSLVENIMVECYGVKTPIIQLASISTPDPKSIIIQPWDKNLLKEIEKVIHSSSLGLNPVNEGNVLRLPIPPLTEERRQELVKLLNQKVETAKVSIRQIREDAWKNLKKDEDDGSISEDELFNQQKELQKFVDEYNKKIQDLGQSKEKEIMTI